MEEKEEIRPIKIGELTDTVLKEYFSMRPVDYIVLAFSIALYGVLLAVFVRWLVVTFVL